MLEATAYNLLFCLIAWVLSVGIFLNKVEQIKNNKLLNALSWFLIPSTVYIWIIGREIIYRIKFGEFDPASVYIVIIIIMPFTLGLIFTFAKYNLEHVDEGEHRLP